MSWVVSVWLSKRVRFLSASVIRGGLPVPCISFWFNAYSITERILFSTTFVERISGLGEDFVFSYIFAIVPTIYLFCA